MDTTAPNDPTLLTPERCDALCAFLHAGLAPALGSTAFPNPEGWSLAGVKREFLMKKHLPVVRLVRAGATLCFIVSPTNPKEPAYKRSQRFDLVYFSEDVPDNAQHSIYQRDRATIDRMVGWLVKFDASAGPLPA